MKPVDNDEILNFISRFNSDGNYYRVDTIDCYMSGCCYWFAYILPGRFSDNGAKSVIDYVRNHFAARIGERVYDITGDVTEYGTWEVWDECEDPLQEERIRRACINF